MAKQMQPEQRKHYEDAMIGFLLAHPEHISEVHQILLDQTYFTNHDNAVTYYFLCEMDSHGIVPKGRQLPAELFRLSNSDSGKKKHLVYSHGDDMALNRSLAQCLALWNKEYGGVDGYKELAKFIKWHCHDSLRIQELAQDIADKVGGVPAQDSQEFATSLSQKFDKIALRVQDAGELQHISEATDDIEAVLDRMGKWEPISNSIETGLKGLDNVLGGLNGGEIIVLAAQTGAGKSLLNSDIIPTPDGWRRVGDIRPDDMLFDRHGRPTRVDRVYPQAEPLEVYEIELKDGRKIKCSEDHLWTVYRMTRKHNKPAWGAVDLSVKDMLAKGYVKETLTENGNVRHHYKFKLPVCEPVEYPEAVLPLDPYFVGAFLGDGSTTDSVRQLTFVCSDEDVETVQRLAEILGASDYGRNSIANYSWHFVLPPEQQSSRRNLFLTRDVFASLPEMCCLANDKCIPAVYKTASVEQRWELVRGLMDTDGAIGLAYSTNGKPKGRLSFATTSQRLAEDFQEVMWSLGIEARISTQDRRGKTHLGPNGKTYVRKSVEYQVNIVCPNDMKEQFFHLERKKALARQLADVKADRDYRFQPIVAIRDLGYKADMTCFLVDNDEHLFLASDYVVTHNTALSMAIAENVALGIGTGEPHSVIIFSLEMMNTQLHFRLASRLGHINTEKFNLDYRSIVNRQTRIDKGENLPPDEIDQLERDKEDFRRRYERLRETVQYAKSLPIYQDTAGNMNVSVMKTMISQKQKEMEENGEPPLGLVIIDYLQILQPTPEDANENRSVVVGNMSRRIKQMAKDAGVPVLLLAQLNRQSDVDQKPKLSHLRESGSIEQDADKVIFLYCEYASRELRDYASEYDTEAQQDLAMKRDQMKVKIAVEKNRQGRQGEVNAIFDKQYQNFVTQTPSFKKGETFETFFDKYYQKTRTGRDLFWPMKVGEVAPILEKYRSIGLVECEYLGPDNQIVLPEDGSRAGATMTVSSRRPARRSAQPTLEEDLGSSFSEDPGEEYEPPRDSVPPWEQTPQPAPRADTTAPAAPATASPQPDTDDLSDPDERYDKGWHEPPFSKGGSDGDSVGEPHSDLDVSSDFGIYDDDDEEFDLSGIEEFSYGSDDDEDYLDDSDDSDDDGDDGDDDGSLALLDELSDKL